jgi:putative membrane protein
MRFILFALLLASSSAFTAQPPNTRLTTKLYGNTQSPPPIPAPKALSYGEESRKYRRTVYTHDDWVIHRSPDRFVRNILTTPSSGIYKNIGPQIASVTAVASCIFLWNMAAGGYTDFEGINHEAIISSQFLPRLALPLTGFTLSSPFLGLLLGKCSRGISLPTCLSGF